MEVREDSIISQVSIYGHIYRVCRSHLPHGLSTPQLATDGPRIYRSGSADEDLEGPSRSWKRPSLWIRNAELVANAKDGEEDTIAPSVRPVRRGYNQCLWPVVALSVSLQLMASDCPTVTGPGYEGVQPPISNSITR